MNPNTQDGTPTRQRTRWLHILKVIGITIVVIMCSCIGLLYYIGSRITPEQRTAMYATSTARAQERATLPATSIPNTLSAAPTQNTPSTATTTSRQNTPTEVALTTSTVQVPSSPSVQATSTVITLSPAPIQPTSPPQTPMPINPTNPPRTNLPVMEGLTLRTARISKSDLDGQWPLSVDTGTIGCDGRNGAGAVVFAPDNGPTYALNGIAKGRTNLSGRRIYLDIDPIWLPNPTVEGLKINIGPLIARALTLCE